jgi:phenylacetate-CoA ligase
MGRRDVQDAGQALFSREIPPGHEPFSTTKSSGSTGEPVVTRRTTVSQFDWLATTLRDHRWHKRDFSLRLCAIRALSGDPVGLPDWGPPASLIFPSAPSLVLPAAMPIKRLADEIAAFKPAYLLVYPSILAGLISHWGDSGGDFSSLREVRLIGETFSPSARSAAQDFLGTRLTDTYSSQEVGNIAFQCPQSGLYHVMAENLRVEILDQHGDPCKPGQAGRVVVSDLRNFATPLLRYDLGDYAEAGAACPCGRGLPTLAGIGGRLRNLVVLPGGERHWPQIGFGDYRKVAPIRQYQLIQHDIDRIEVRLVADTAVSADQEAALTAIIQRKLGYAFELRFEYFAGRLPAGAGGKFEEFMCMI